MFSYTCLNINFGLAWTVFYGMLGGVLSGLVLPPWQLSFKGGFPKCWDNYQSVLKLIVIGSERDAYRGARPEKPSKVLWSAASRVSALKSDGVLKWLKLFTFMSERTPCGKKHKFLAMRQRTQILGQKNPYPSNFCLHPLVCLCYPNYLEPTSCLHLCIAISIRTWHRYRTLSRLWVGPNQILFFEQGA